MNTPFRYRLFVSTTVRYVRAAISSGSITSRRAFTAMLTSLWLLMCAGAGHAVSPGAIVSERTASDMLVSPRGILRWNVILGERRFRHPSSVSPTRVAIAPDGAAITSAAGTSLKVWDADTGKELWTRFTDPIHSVSAMRFTPRGSSLVTGGYSTVHIWNAATGKLLRTLRHDKMSWVDSLDVDSTGKWVVVCGRGSSHASNHLFLWDIEKGAMVSSWESPQENSIVRFTPDGKYVVSAATFNGRVHIWDRTSQQIVAALDAGNVADLDISSDGKWFITVGEYHVSRMWHIPDGSLIGTLYHHDDYHAVSISPDDKIVVTGLGAYGDKSLTIWDVISKKKVGGLDSSKDKLSVDSIAFAPSGSWIVTGLHSGHIRRWQLGEGSLVEIPLPSLNDGHAAPVTGLAMAGSRRVVASTGEDGVLAVWDAESYELLDRLKEQTIFGFSTVALNPAGDLLV